jgi:hypothetical protein
MMTLISFVLYTQAQALTYIIIALLCKFLSKFALKLIENRRKETQKLNNAAASERNKERAEIGSGMVLMFQSNAQRSSFPE